MTCIAKSVRIPIRHLEDIIRNFGFSVILCSSFDQKDPFAKRAFLGLSRQERITVFCPDRQNINPK